MKDESHHMKHVQKKVIQYARREAAREEVNNSSHCEHLEKNSLEKNSLEKEVVAVSDKNHHGRPAPIRIQVH